MRCWFLLAIPAVIAAGASGCGREGGSAPTPPVRTMPPAAVTTSNTITRAELDQVPDASPSGRRTRLALIVKTRNNPFFDPMIRAAEAEARRMGADLEVQSPQQEADKERQFAIVQDVAARKVDAILIAPADSKGIVPALKQAQERGILVINLDNRVDASTAAAAGLALGGYVGADNEEGGRLAGKAMIERLTSLGLGGSPDKVGNAGNPGNRDSSGSSGRQAEVAVLEGIRGADNAEARKRGFLQATHGKVNLAASDSAEWDTQKAYAKFRSMLAARPALNGLFCANDKMALGALKAIQEAGKMGQITVIGYDNIPDVRPYLQRGELYATIEQHPDLMGRYGVRMALGVLKGTVPRGREFLVPLEVIQGSRSR
jgi:ribose transport system substrate-binding protein